jgi:hypothetical protein
MNATKYTESSYPNAQSTIQHHIAHLFKCKQCPLTDCEHLLSIGFANVREQISFTLVSLSEYAPVEQVANTCMEFICSLILTVCTYYF